MIAGRRRHRGESAAATPYPERADRKESRLDGALLGAWGRISPYLPSVLRRGKLARLVRSAEGHEQRITGLTDKGLREVADALRDRLQPAGAGVDEVAQAFALAREASRRHCGKRQFPVQLLGGAVMMGGALAEMQTGEGKTLTALLPAIAGGLMRRPVHIVTVNDYLARRDAEELGPVYRALGLSVGLVEHGQQAQDRQRAYACDVTYCTNKELVFDYLRDRLALGDRRARTRLMLDDLFNLGAAGWSQRLLLRGLHFAIVDEADSVLIDEARTPLILSGMQEEADDVSLYETALDLARRLAQGEDFRLLAGEKTIRLTPRGTRRAQELSAGLPGLWAIRRAREEVIRQSLQALHVFQRDVQYIVAAGKVQIVDEYTGRVMPDRSWEHGMHQLIEAKEQCVITQRHRTLARITYQQFFRRYHHLCGMTGTALETAGELRAVYGLRVVRVPTNKPLRRRNAGTQLFGTSAQKWDAVVRSASAAVRAGRAVLIGTRSVDASEHLAADARRGRAATGHPQCAAGSPGGRHRGGRRAAGAGHGGDQHGRPRHRHSAAPRREGGGRPACDPDGVSRSPGASTGSCSAARDGRAIPAATSRSSPSTTSCSAVSPASRSFGWRKREPATSRRSRRRWVPRCAGTVNVPPSACTRGPDASR